jgi:hypothetical protein
MKSFKMLSVAAIAGLLLAGCAGVAHIEKDESVNLSNYKSFAWVQTKDTTTANEKSKTITLTEQTVRKAVNEELVQEGWKEAKGRPDVLLSYDVLVENTIKQSSDPVYSRPQMRYFFNPYTRRWSNFYYPSQFLGYDRNEYRAKEGTVTITMVDAKTDKVIWQGWTTEEVNSKNFTSKELQASIRNIFRKFDVAKN